MKKTVVALLLFMGAAFPYVVGLHVEPVKAQWSGWTPSQYPNNYVSEVITINFDEPITASLFCGARGAGGDYHVSLRTIPGDVEIASGDTNSPRDHSWATCTLLVSRPDSFIKGRQIEVRWTRSGSDSIQYYYDSTDCYKYGGMAVGQQVPIPNPNDLACRVYGRMNAVDSAFFGADEASWEWHVNPIVIQTFRSRIEESKVRAVRFDLDWNYVQHAGKNSWNWNRVDSTLTGIRADDVCRPLALVTGTPADSWASTRWDNKASFGRESAYAWSPHCAPRGLEYPVTSDSNLLARFINSVVHRYDSGSGGLGMPIHDWEVWNEPNDTTTRTADSPDSFQLYTGWWRRPNTYYQTDSGPSSLCALYMRMAQVVDSVVKSHSGHEADRVAIGSMASVFWANDAPDKGVVPGRTWLDTCYAVASDSGWGVFWDAVSVHDYQGGDYFLPESLRVHAETLRAIMRKCGDVDGELWNTEFGWNNIQLGYDTLQDARNLCEAFVSHKASEANPGGGYDRLYWWYFRRPGIWNAWGLISDALDPQAPFYAMKQVAGGLTGKRLNGRVTMGGTKDDSVRVYEFEDPTSLKKTWVCWKNGGEGQGAVSVNLPARADTSACTVLDYGDNPQEGDSSALASGWLPHALTERPVFITEKSDTTRPDIVVDSLKLVPSPLIIGSPATARIYFQNAGNDTTPEGPATGEYGFVVLRHNGDSVAYAICSRPLAPNHSDSVSVSVSSVPASWRGWALFDATANYGQQYVELNGMDDNSGYSRNRVVLSPVVDIGVVLCGHHGNEPLPLFSFETHDLEADTTGQTPCDSARLVQWWYGLNDTVVHGGDTTAWFDASAAVALDTSWLYLSGQGRYRVGVQVKDRWSQSDVIFDTTHPFVVFDTTGPTGSVGLNRGSRFTTGSTCTLSLAASDSISGVAMQRFMNVPRINLVQNGSFTATGGSWSYNGGGSGYDTTLGMAKLATGGSTCVRQFIPAESISAYSGDSCVLQASVMALMHGGNALVDLSYFNYFCRTDTSLHDTSWTLVDSATFQDSLAFWGQAPGAGNTLARRFLLTTPAAESGWVWRGGMVRVQAVGINGATGTVWADQVALMGFQPDTGYAWWGPYETLTTWNIGTSAGQHIVRALYLDSAGNENAATIADTIILDPTAPVVDISQPGTSQLVNGVVEIAGVAYDTIEVPGDTWFQRRTLSYRRSDSTNWLPVLPDSCSDVPAYPDSQQILGPAVHLGYWNTLSVPNGQYYLKLTATDSAGHVSSCSTWVMVFHGGGGGMGNGPEGGGEGLGEGSVFVGSATGTVLHLSDALDSLDAYSVSDSGSQAKVTAILEVGNDSLLVLDAANRRIHKLHKSGQHRRRLVSGLSQPVDLKRDDNGNLWLADRGWNRIGKFRSNGTLVFVRGGLGADSLHFDAPEGIAVKGSLVYVADAGNNRIAVWDTSGHFKTTITGEFESPTAVYVTDEGTIYLTDGSDGKLKGITSLGGSIVVLGTEDSSKLKGLVPSENRHSLFSLAPEPNKVYKLRIRSDDSAPGGQQSAGKVNLPKTLSLAQPFPNPARTRLNIAYALPRQTRVVLKLYDVAGKLVTTLANGEQKPGYYNLTWNRQDTKGRSCACGVYFCTLAAENQRFSRKVVLTE